MLTSRAGSVASREHQSHALALLGYDFDWSDWQQRFLRSVASQHHAPSERQAEILNEMDSWQEMVTTAREYRDVSTIIARHTQLRKRHKKGELVGLCPFHTERTPSLGVNDDKGAYHCLGCGASGGAITALMRLDGMSFRQAVEALSGDALPIISPEERARRKAEDAREIAERVAIARSIAERIVNPAGTPAEVYARSRGITAPLPSTVGFVMTPKWHNRETGEVGPDHPAMAFVAQDAGGEVVGVHCVFLADGGRRKDERTRGDGTKDRAKLSFGLIAGPAIRLAPPASELIVCEGPEDGLTLMQELGRPVWVAAGTAMLSRMEFPPEVRSVVIGGDGDEPGRLAAREAAKAFALRGLAEVRTFFPEAPHKDFNEQLTEGARA